MNTVPPSEWTATTATRLTRTGTALSAGFGRAKSTSQCVGAGMAKRRVEVWWVDAQSAQHPHESRLVPRRSIGWLTKRTKTKVTIAQTRNREGGKTVYEDFLAIPRSTVRRIRRLR